MALNVLSRKAPAQIGKSDEDALESIETAFRLTRLGAAVDKATGNAEEEFSPELASSYLHLPSGLTATLLKETEMHDFSNLTCSTMDSISDAGLYSNFSSRQTSDEPTPLVYDDTTVANSSNGCTSCAGLHEYEGTPGLLPISESWVVPESVKPRLPPAEAARERSKPISHVLARPSQSNTVLGTFSDTKRFAEKGRLLRPGAGPEPTQSHPNSDQVCTKSIHTTGRAPPGLGFMQNQPNSDTYPCGNAVNSPFGKGQMYGCSHNKHGKGSRGSDERRPHAWQRQSQFR